jgi:hypothetical protein
MVRLAAATAAVMKAISAPELAACLREPMFVGMVRTVIRGGNAGFSAVK